MIAMCGAMHPADPIARCDLPAGHPGDHRDAVLHAVWRATTPAQHKTRGDALLAGADALTALDRVRGRLGRVGAGLRRAGPLRRLPPRPHHHHPSNRRHTMSNIDRAADVIARCWPNGRGVRKDDSAILAQALADATPTLLMPDLPEPGSGGIWEGEGGSWVVSPLQGGVCVHVYEDLTPDEARGLALAILAAPDYAEEVGTDEA